MYEYAYGEKLSDEMLSYYRNKLIEVFAQEYDIRSNRLWNCIRYDTVCLEFEDARMLKVPQSVIFYLERNHEVYNTTFTDVCKYVEQLELWEDIDAYVFDDTFTWLLSITHNDLKCLVLGLEE